MRALALLSVLATLAACAGSPPPPPPPPPVEVAPPPVELPDAGPGPTASPRPPGMSGGPEEPPTPAIRPRPQPSRLPPPDFAAGSDLPPASPPPPPPPPPPVDPALAQKEAIKRGIGAFTVPRTMIRDSAYTATLNIAAARPGEPTPAPNPAEADTTRVAMGVGRCMTARLFGEGFEVKPAEAVQKRLGLSDAETWDWSVTPRRGGALRLTMEARIQAEIDGRCGTQLEVYPPQVVAVGVEVGFWPRVKDWFTETTPILGLAKGWLVALAAVLTALGTVVANTRGLFGGKPAPKPPA